MVLFGLSQKKLNFIYPEDPHGVASLQSLNQSSLAFPSPLKGKVPGEVNIFDLCSTSPPPAREGGNYLMGVAALLK
jgi:hypothetical protein